MKEYIDKDAALEAIFQNALDPHAAYQAVRKIKPIADLRPEESGKWEAIDFHTVKCSKCGFDMDIMRVYAHVLNHANFCPNCGLRMVNTK